MNSRAITVTLPTAVQHYSRWYWFKWRIAEAFHPVSVTDAWYEQGCPQGAAFDRSGISRFDRVRWAIDKWLRECGKRSA